jgi:hypothetical protein
MTIQVRDALSVDDQVYRLATSPLETFFGRDPARRPVFEAPDSSVWRGYVAEWSLDAGRLYLVGLAGWVRDESAPSSLREVGIESIFPEAEAGDRRVLADWFSGELEAEESGVSLSTRRAGTETGGGHLAGWLVRDLQSELADDEPETADAPDAGTRVFRIDAGRLVGEVSLSPPDRS